MLNVLGLSQLSHELVNLGMSDLLSLKEVETGKKKGSTVKEPADYQQRDL